MSCSREFTHRVKSVSMAKFTSQEVDALQNGGNQVQGGLFSFDIWSHIYFLVEMRFICVYIISACTGNIFEKLGLPKAAVAG